MMEKLLTLQSLMYMLYIRLREMKRMSLVDKLNDKNNPEYLLIQKVGLPGTQATERSLIF